MAQRMDERAAYRWAGGNAQAQQSPLRQTPGRTGAASSPTLRQPKLTLVPAQKDVGQNHHPTCSNSWRAQSANCIAPVIHGHLHQQHMLHSALMQALSDKESYGFIHVENCQLGKLGASKLSTTPICLVSMHRQKLSHTNYCEPAAKYSSFSPQALNCARRRPKRMEDH